MKESKKMILVVDDTPIKLTILGGFYRNTM